jgi:HD domain
MRHDVSVKSPDMVRRFVVVALGGVVLSVSARVLAGVAAGPSAGLPRDVAGVRLPDSPLATASADLARAACPPFLFNHCMRTFLFGAMLAERDRISYDEELIFVAAAMHDLGLTREYASADRPFEVDGADAAKAFLVSRGVSETRAEVVWNAVALHTSVLVEHQARQVGLIGDGAGADVFGSQLDTLPRERVLAVVAAFPRLSFNTQFRDLLVDHCQRKPFSQRGTWLDSLCRSHNPQLQYPELESRIVGTRVGE